MVEVFVDGAWTDITALRHVYDRDPIAITRGRADESSQMQTSRCALTLNNRDGRYSPRNPTGPYFQKIGRNTPLRVSVGSDVRFVGEVSEWPQQWDKPGVDVWTPIEAAGILRRLGQGAKPLASTMRRALTASDLVIPPVAYWPCEDGRDSHGSIASGLPGGEAMGTSAFTQFADFSDFACSDPLPTSSSNAGRGWDGRVPGYTAGVQTQVRFLFHITTGVVDQGIFSVRTTGTATGWILYYRASGSLELVALDDDGAELGTTGVGSPGGSIDGRTVRLSIEMTQNGADVDFGWVLLDVGDEIGTADSATLTGETVGRVVAVSADPNGGIVTGTEKAAYGHISVHPGITSIYDLEDELRAFDGEPAGRRIQRLAGEEDIGFSFINIGNLDETTAMGTQQPATVLDLLHECADADGGILYEPRDNLALTYRTRMSLYNQPDALVLDYQAGVFSEVPAPVDDDQHTRNDVTVTRRGGSSARAVLSSGPLSTADPPDGVGVYDAEETVNVVGDGFLPDQASWRLGLGTVDEARYPQLGVGLHMGGFAFSTSANLAAPGTFETDLESWAGGGSVSPTVTRDNTRAHGGTWSMKIVWGTGGLFPQSAKTIAGLTVGTRYQVAGFAWVTPGSPAVRFAVATVSPAGPSTVTEGVWERFTFRFTATATSHSLQVWPARDPVAGETVWVDDVTFQATSNGDDVAGLDIGDRLVIENLPAWLPPDDVAQLAQGFTEELSNFTWDVRINAVPASPYTVAVYEDTAGDPNKYDTDGSELPSAISATGGFSVITTRGPLWTDVDA
ncbi:MAG: hypothetical protein ACRD0W_09680, partial [Acidimicrobiales bacterium]